MVTNYTVISLSKEFYYQTWTLRLFSFAATYLFCHLMFNLIKKWKEPVLYGSGALKHFILDKSKLVHEKYCPPLLCLHPAVQFFVRTKYEKPPQVKINKSVLALADGGAVAFDGIAIDKGPSDHSNYVIVILPGLRESTHTVKVLALAKSLNEHGFPHVFVLNHRASCSIPLQSKRLSFACGEHNHVNEGVADIESRFPEKKIVLAGGCLGAMCIIDYLSTSQSNRPSIVGSVVHSCNWQLKSGPSKVASGVNYHLFNKALVKDTIMRIEKCASDEESALKDEWHKERGLDMDKLRAAKSIWELEEYYVAPLNGLSGADEYYQLVSPVNKVHKVKKPLVVINSRDDFMAPFENMNLTEFTKNPNLVLWSTAAGGHVSFVDGLFPVTSYLDRAVPECVELLCDFVKEDECRSG